MSTEGTELQITSLCPSLGERYAIIKPGICDPNLQNPNGKEIPGGVFKLFQTNAMPSNVVVN